MQTITKVTLIANNGVFKNLIQNIIDNKDLRKFKIVFSANIVETQIIITEKKRIKASSEDWAGVLQFLESKTFDLTFKQAIE